MRPFGPPALFGAAAGLLLLIGLASPAAGQVIVHIEPPPPGQFYIEDLWKLHVTNGSPEEYTVYLRGTVDDQAVHHHL